METKPRPRFLWTDLETTGLDPFYGAVLEIAMIVTEPDLSEVARFHAVFPTHDRRDEVDAMDVSVFQMHHASGLLLECERVDEPRPRIWERVTDFVLTHRGETPILAGSTVHFDRSWLLHHALGFERWGVHYRLLDVSGVRELLRATGRDAPERADKPHRAMPDVEASLALGRWLAAGMRNAVFPEGAP